MLELCPGCEHCDTDLPPAAGNARICSFECTFCADCAETILHNVCPNCGGGFSPRPVRPAQNWKGGNDLVNYPASTTRKYRPVDLDAHQELLATFARTSCGSTLTLLHSNKQNQSNLKAALHLPHLF